MGYLGEPPEGRFHIVFRCMGYFAFGAFLALIPAAWIVAATSTRNIAWRVPIMIVVGSGLFFCLLGVLTRGRLLIGLLRLLGRHVDPP